MNSDDEIKFETTITEAFVTWMIAVVFVATSVIAYGYHGYKNDSAECRKHLTEGYKCVKVYVQVPKGE